MPFIELYQSLTFSMFLINPIEMNSSCTTLLCRWKKNHTEDRSACPVYRTKLYVAAWLTSRERYTAIFIIDWSWSFNNTYCRRVIPSLLCSREATRARSNYDWLLRLTNSLHIITRNENSMTNKNHWNSYTWVIRFMCRCRRNSFLELIRCKRVKYLIERKKKKNTAFNSSLGL